MRREDQADAARCRADLRCENATRTPKPRRRDGVCQRSASRAGSQRLVSFSSTFGGDLVRGPRPIPFYPPYGKL